MLRVILFLLIAAISGCVPVYVPQRHNVPMHSEKKEFQGSVCILQGLNFQAAYSITNHLGLTCNYLYADNKGKDTEEYRTQNAGEFGFGYFNHFKKDWWVEMYAGYGAGNATAFGYDYFLFTGDEYSVSGKYQKIYFQPSIGFQGDELISNLSIKCSMIDFTRLKFLVDGVEETLSVQPKLFISPAATIRIPILGEYLFGTVQVGLNIATGSEPAFDYEPIMASAGLQFKITHKKTD